MGPSLLARLPLTVIPAAGELPAVLVSGTSARRPARCRRQRHTG